MSSSGLHSTNESVVCHDNAIEAPRMASELDTEKLSIASWRPLRARLRYESADWAICGSLESLDKWDAAHPNTAYITKSWVNAIEINL